MHAIEIINVSKEFKGKKGAVVEAVKGLSLAIDQGEVFGFLGPNGAGKSTTLKILMGLIAPTSGHASILGTDSQSYLSRKYVGYLPEHPAFYDYLTAYEYLAFVGRTFQMAKTVLAEKSEYFLKLLDLWNVRQRPISGYSKGMVQRLGIAQVLIHDPAVYILDEPMSGLDPIGRALVKDIILELKKRGKCVFFSTHITSDVETICDRVGIIVKGTLRCVERVASLMREGVVGYHLYIKDKNSFDVKEVYVTKDQLPAFIQETQVQEQEITMIEPRRKNLEDFFLGIVREQK